MTFLPAPPLSRQSTLVVADITEPSNNDLRLILVEVRPSSSTVEADVVQMRLIEPQSDSRVFEVMWWRYVTYAVRNESFFRPEDGEQLRGQATGTRVDTALLAYAKATTFASDDFPGALSHYFVYSEWHCVDVISDTPPDVRELTGAERAFWAAKA